MEQNQSSESRPAPRRPRRSRAMRLTAWLLAVMAIVLITGGVTAWTVLRPCRLVRDDDRIRIPDGASAEQVRDSMQAVLGDDDGSVVWYLWRFWKGTPRRSHGSYVVVPGRSLLKFSRQVAYGQQTPVKVRFNGVRTIDMLADKLAAQVESPSDSIMNAMTRVLGERGYTRAEFPAAFIPDTYEFYWTVSPDRLVSSLAGARDRFWTQQRRDRASDLGLNPVQVAVLASIVEEETASAAERPIVARLYLNRLGKGMPLQADPTVKFAVGDFALRRILNSHLATQSPYNTYINKGLPPGPIRVPEAASLRAVLDAPAHNYLYMCAKPDGSGTHAFAVDYATHMANARSYHRHLDSRGIK